MVFLLFLSTFMLFVQIACDMELASGLSEAEAQEALVVLQQYGVAAEKEKVGEGEEATWTLKVPSDESARANQILEKYELPRKKPKGLDEVFSATGLIPTATEEKARYLMALQGEIAQTLETVDGIVTARIHIVIPDKNPLAVEEEAVATAGVFIKYRGEHQPLTHEEIKQIVSHAVDDLEEAQVAVVMKKIHFDQIEVEPIGTPKKTSPLSDERTKLIILVLAGVCIILAAILIFLLKTVQKEKRRRLQMQRELSVLSSAGSRK